MRTLAAVTAILASLAGTVAAKPKGDAAKLATLQDKNGFRDAKLGTPRADIEGLQEAGTLGVRAAFTRASDKMTLFETKLASIVYAFEGGVLDRIVITGAWTLDPKMSLCEGNNQHIRDNLSAVFGKPTKIHGYSSGEGKRCVAEQSGGLESPYCRVFEWRTRSVRLTFFSVVTTSPGAPPPGVHRDEGWKGHSCRFALEYARVHDPSEDL